jgi:hypothetical protein
MPPDAPQTPQITTRPGCQFTLGMIFIATTVLALFVAVCVELYGRSFVEIARGLLCLFAGCIALTVLMFVITFVLGSRDRRRGGTPPDDSDDSN